MKRFLTLITSVLVLAACSEWDPVLTCRYEEPPVAEPVVMTPTHTIKQLCQLYKGKPLTISDDIIIAGKVSTTDEPGNFYKSFYIQDETAGIEIKVGKNSLYDDYHPGQTVYVSCKDLTIGMYGYKSGNYGGQGMVQVGFSDPSGAYETSYIESPLVIASHIYCGERGEKVQPVVVSASQLPGKDDDQRTNQFVGKLVTLEGLQYDREVFALFYPVSSLPHTSEDPWNRVFLSDDGTWGINTWAMSKAKFVEYLASGVWDDAEVGSGSTHYGPITGSPREYLTPVNAANFGSDADLSYKQIMAKYATAYSISHYFSMGSKQIQIRTSGFSKFGDREIPADVYSGARKINVTGILTVYQGSVQLVVNSLDDFTDTEGNSLYQ